MVSLLLMGRNYLRGSGERLRLVNIPLAIHQYLSRMDFFSAGIFDVPLPLNEKYMLRRSAFSSRIIEIIEIPNKERKSIAVINSVISVFRKRSSHILRYWMNESVIDYFVTVISELCQNVFEHSLDSGYLSMQTYTVGRENIFRLVISDSGTGIRGSFEKKSGIHYDSTAHLIEMALTKPISSKRDFGFGLCQVNTILNRMKGTIYIRSDDACVTAMYQKTKPGSSPIFIKNNLCQFNGTQISISLFA
jgi:signal transduction histidine kinase